MGGLGSGRWQRHSRKRWVTELDRLDIRQMRRDDWLLPHTVITLHGPGMLRRLTIEVDDIEVDEDGQVDRIKLTWRPCHLGGRRPVMHCPCCGRAVYLLYRCDQWVCRQCARLSYVSQGESASLRAIDRANRLRRRIDPASCLMLPIPARPARMHQRTYDLRVRRIQCQEAGLVQTLVAQYEGMRAALACRDMSAHFFSCLVPQPRLL